MCNKNIKNNLIFFDKCCKIANVQKIKVHNFNKEKECLDIEKISVTLPNLLVEKIFKTDSQDKEKKKL